MPHLCGRRGHDSECLLFGYLSLKACKTLGLVPDDFPYQPRAVAMVGGLHVTRNLSTLDDDLSLLQSEEPLSPLEGNVARLEDWLLRHFSSIELLQ